MASRDDAILSLQAIRHDAANYFIGAPRHASHHILRLRVSLPDAQQV